jgi:hypothetical protein
VAVGSVARRRTTDVDFDDRRWWWWSRWSRWLASDDRLLFVVALLPARAFGAKPEARCGCRARHSRQIAAAKKAVR